MFRSCTINHSFLNCRSKVELTFTCIRTRNYDYNSMSMVIVDNCGYMYVYMVTILLKKKTVSLIVQSALIKVCLTIIILVQKLYNKQFIFNCRSKVELTFTCICTRNYDYNSMSMVIMDIITLKLKIHAYYQRLN